MSIESEFECELEIFRREAEAGAQFFYAYLTLHAVASEDPSVYCALNSTPLFWNATLAGLQSAAIIALGRVFDQNSPHNIDRVLRHAENNPQLFSKQSLAARKQGAALNPPKWLAEYVAAAYEPTPEDFRRLRAHVKKRRKIYDSNYRDLRHKVFAHMEIAERSKVDALFAKTNIRELQQLFVFISSFYESLWQLFFNGEKPTLRPRRFSVARIRVIPSAAGHRAAVQERMVHEAEHMLRQLASAAVGGNPPRAKRSQGR
ncbi:MULTISPECIES: AbiU2 domain-containing protein [Burkholderia]|uniref:AbiU2 domain-containing protein n=1 Tax=Burkholderia TaxID=32008 RepID=UPI00103C8ADB|nr:MULTISPECIES: hypothetical protein [Burkholderia]